VGPYVGMTGVGVGMTVCLRDGHLLTRGDFLLLVNAITVC
jgi:hypothetical protein